MADLLIRSITLIGDPDDVPDAFFSALAALLLHAGDASKDPEVCELEGPEGIEAQAVVLTENAS